MTLVYVLIGIFCLYAFQGIFSFVPYFFGLFFKFFYFPVEIISQVIYPVGNIVYIVYLGLFSFFVIRFIIKMIPIFHN